MIGRADPEWGEVVVAYIVGDPDPAELDRLCIDRIARFKRPKEYVFVPNLPKTAPGRSSRPSCVRGTPRAPKPSVDKICDL